MGPTARDTLCGLPGATPALEEYLGGCGVAPLRLPELPMRVCDEGGNTRGCLRRSELLSKCDAVCGTAYKEATTCESVCKDSHTCIDTCEKEGRVCRVDARRTCKQSTSALLEAGSGSDQGLKCKAASFGSCTWRRCSGGSGSEGQQFWTGRPMAGDATSRAA